jgi:hypothetical protein
MQKSDLFNSIPNKPENILPQFQKILKRTIHFIRYSYQETNTEKTHNNGVDAALIFKSKTPQKGTVTPSVQNTQQKLHA